MPPSPPRFGGQARMHGLLTALARRHDVTAFSLAESGFDRPQCEAAMRQYCPDSAIVPSPNSPEGNGKRMLQLRSLMSLRSFEDIRYDVAGMQTAIDEACRRKNFDVVNVEFPYLMRYRFHRKNGAGAPPVVLDTHEIEYDILRQMVSRPEFSKVRRGYNALNWRKVRREEQAAFRAADGVACCSVDDQRRVLFDAPGARTALVPNGADVEFFQPRATDPQSDGKTVMFFGTMGYYPNVDGVLWMLKEIWPRIAARHPQAKLKIVGLKPPAEILAYRSPTIEVTGFVEDLRPHIASAAVLVAPLRVGGGTRLKILEGMAMARPTVSTTLGAEGIDAKHERDILIADSEETFANQVGRILAEPALGTQLGGAGRKLVVEKYSWEAASQALESLFRASISAREGARA